MRRATLARWAIPLRRGLGRGDRGNRRYRGRSMISTALRPVGHIAAWLVWHSTGISLLADLDEPAVRRSE